MNKLSLSAAVALLALPGVAQAKVPVLDLGSICHFLVIVVDETNVNGFSNYTCATNNFIGVIGKVNGARSVIASIQVKHKHTPFLLQLSYPLVDGGAWSMYYTRSGYNMKVYDSGTYTVTR